MIEIKVRDENMAGKVSNEFTLEVQAQDISLRDMIKLRIYHEVAEHNQKTPEYFNGLVQPTDAEKILNGFKLREKRQIDAEKQYYLALDFFQKNGFFVLIDNQQYTDLDELIPLKQTSTISFIKLTPLIGG